MDLTVKTPPSATSIDIGLVKAGRRVRTNSEDSLVLFWIKAADAYIEKRTNLALMEQTLVLRLRRVLPVVYLPRTASAEIVHIKYAVGDVETTMLDGDYSQTVDRMVTRIDTGLVGQIGSMEIEYKAGAADAEQVPAALRQASYLLAAHYMVAREASFLDPRIMNVDKKIVFGVDSLVKEFRVPNGHELNGGW